MVTKRGRKPKYLTTVVALGIEYARRILKWLEEENTAVVGATKKGKKLMVKAVSKFTIGGGAQLEGYINQYKGVESIEDFLDYVIQRAFEKKVDDDQKELGRELAWAKNTVKTLDFTNVPAISTVPSNKINDWVKGITGGEEDPGGVLVPINMVGNNYEIAKANEVWVCDTMKFAKRTERGGVILM